MTVLFLAIPAVALAAPALRAPSPQPTEPSATKLGGTNRATFGIQPVTNGKPDSRTALTYGATEGGTITDKVAVINYSDRALALAVYASDAINTSAGEVTLLDPNKKPTDAGSWITLGGRARSGSITLKAHSYAIVPLSVKVPADASPGDHVAGVVADLVALSKRNGVNVRLHQRVGPPVYIRVAGAVRPNLAVEDLTVTYHTNWNPIGSGSATVSYRVRNTGNVSLGARQRVSIDGLFGQTSSVAPPTIPLLLPGSSVDYTVQVHGVFPEISMSAKVELTPVVPDGAVDEGVHKYAATSHFWAVPWVLIAVIAALAAGGAWRWQRRRRIRNLPGRHNEADRVRARETSPAREEVEA